MFDAQQKANGTGHTRTVAFAVIALLFVPAALILWRPDEYAEISHALACSALYAELAWVSWMKFSQLSMRSIKTETTK